MKHETCNMKHTEKYITKSAKETQKVAVEFARQILRQKKGNKALILALRGDLGSGKTTFLQGFARGLGIKEKILSPTFIIMKKFPINVGGRTSHIFEYFYHIDCYRLHRPKEVLSLGFKEIISDPKNIVAIEWPERISKILPQKTISIKFKHLKNNQRKLTITE